MSLSGEREGRRWSEVKGRHCGVGNQMEGQSLLVGAMRLCGVGEDKVFQ